MRLVLFFLLSITICGNVFALQGDPPLWQGNCSPDYEMRIDSPDLPIPVSVARKMIKDRAWEMFKARISPYTKINPETGKEVYRARYQPQIDAIHKEVDQWQTRAKDKLEKYLEVDPCPNSMGLVIRQKYLDLVW